MRRIPVILLALVLAASASAEDPIGENFYPPELLLENQQSIGLTAEQKQLVRSEVGKAQTRFTELQWQIQDAVQEMEAMVKQPRVSEANVLAQLERVLELERQIKRTHLQLVIRIKNAMTPAQQAKLQELRAKK